MTLYGKFRKLDIDFSQLGLEQRGACDGYFCTPKGAEVIGWAGVDGIHCCFIKGLGEMVFAVNPSNLPGDNVHPLARSFADFLRLILSCGLDAAEQAHLWSREDFDTFLWESDPPEPERQAALDSLRNELKLAPMDDPYGYIREVQAAFDYSKIPYRKDYYECVPDGPKAPERPEWKVYFANGFDSRHTGHDRQGSEISVGKTFIWGGKTWHIPAVYICGKGLVVDICMEVAPDELRQFFEKWWPREKEGRDLTAEERERQEAENPMDMRFNPSVTVNGRELRRRSGRGFGWVPVSCRPEEERGEPRRQDWEALWLMEHYSLDSRRGWMFWRESFPWATKTKPAVKTLSIFLTADPVFVPGARFTVFGAGECVPFINPVTGETHTLHVVEYETQEMDAGVFYDADNWEYPTHYAAMSYAVEPELPRQAMTVRDCGEGDRPRVKHSGPAGPTASCSVGIIGGADGPVAFIMANGKSAQTKAVCSSLYFEPPERIEWRMVFFEKTVEDVEIELMSEE